MSCKYQTLITAHTGCENSVENTTASVLAGIEAGADIIEIDIRTSADGLPVLIHNPAIRGTDGSSLAIAEHPYDSVATFASNHGVELSPLEDVLALIKERQCMLNLDVKDIAGIDRLSRLIASFDLLDNVIITGCTESWAQVVVQQHPELQVLLNAYYDLSSLDEQSYITYVSMLCRTAISAGCCGINIDFRMCRPELSAFARKRFLPVAVWTVDSEDDMLSMLSMGVSAITTYYPRRLYSIIHEA
jgi:glycerophosphoryl diester phosphodiesterase